MSDSILVTLTRLQLEAVTNLVGAAVSGCGGREEGPLYEAERELDGALLRDELDHMGD
jgi:hypothetical protein